VTRLLDIFNAAMAHPKDSDEREAGLRELGEAIRRQARGCDLESLVEEFRPTLMRDMKQAGLIHDWARRAAGEKDED
jgi:hypothetical protein